MQTRAEYKLAEYQQVLNGILQTLPEERVRQIVEYARFLQVQNHDELESQVNPDPNGTSATDSDEPDPLDQEVAYFEEQHSELVKKYLGKYIAMYQGEVIAQHTSFEALINEVRQEHPSNAVLFRQVQKTLPPTLVFRTPRIEKV